MSDKPKITNFLRRLFFPRDLTCSACGKECFTGKILCEDCLGKIEKNDGFICDHCGAGAPAPVSYCDRCRNKLTSFEKSRSVYIYGEVVALLIRKLKYGGEKYLAEEFAKELYKTFLLNETYADGVVCVPMSKKRKRERGYNQSELLARRFSELSGIPFWDVTVKRKETESQVGKSYNERRKNPDGSFGVSDKKQIEGKRLVLVDDVTTTGTTADVLSAALKRAGASEVFVLTVASVPLRSLAAKTKNSDEDKTSAERSEITAESGCKRQSDDCKSAEIIDL